MESSRGSCDVMLAAVGTPGFGWTFRHRLAQLGLEKGKGPSQYRTLAGAATIHGAEWIRSGCMNTL